MARIVVDVKNTIGIEQGNITGTGTDSNPTRIHSLGFIAFEYTGAPPSELVISATTSTGKTLNVSYVIYNTPNYTDISYDPDAWLSNPCTADLSGKTNVNYIKTYARYSDNSNIAPSDITEWTITYDNGIAFEIGDDGYPVPIDAPVPAEYAMQAPYPDSVFRIDPAYNYGYPFNALMPDIPHSGGAFARAADLAAVRIPISVKTIGTEAFKDTALQRVRIAADCTYGAESFPEGCVVTRYPDDRYEQLYDCDGKAVLDCDGARVYVLKEDISNG